MKKTKAPRHLRPETRRWFRLIAERFVLEAHHERQLLLACEAWDRHLEARDVLAAEGLTVKNKYDEVKCHPCVNIERDARSAFLRCIRELGLDLAEEPARPPIVQPSQRKGNA